MPIANPTAIDTIYSQFLAQQPIHRKALLNANKAAVLDQAFANKGIDAEARLSLEDLDNIQQELQAIIYSAGSMPSFITNGDILEDTQCDDEAERMARNARNILRHIVRGVPFGEESASLSSSKLYTDEIKQTLFTKRDPKLLAAVRVEFQQIFQNAFTQLPNLDEDCQKQFAILLSNLLSAYPFVDPEENEVCEVPQKINDTWVKIKYRFEKIDVSPQKGLLSFLIEPQDRMYMYGLVPCEGQSSAAQPQLLLMGTTYPAGQGNALATIYNFAPFKSVGEGHDWTHLDAWIKRHQHIKVNGHSKGAALAMMVAAKYPDYVSEANCLNPPGLCQRTLESLKDLWEGYLSTHTNSPRINIYAQRGDPVFPWDNGFFRASHIYRIIPNTEQCAMNFKYAPTPLLKAYEAHIHHFAGRSEALVINVELGRENARLKRVFLADLKSVINFLFFPIEYTSFVIKLLARKAERFHDQHRKTFKALLFLSLLALTASIMAGGWLLPGILPIVSYVTTGMTGLFASILATEFLPPLIKYSLKAAALITSLTVKAATFGILATMAILIGIKTGVNALFFSPVQDSLPSQSATSSSQVDMLRRLGNSPQEESIPSLMPAVIPAREPSQRVSTLFSSLNPGNDQKAASENTLAFIGEDHLQSPRNS